MGAPLVRIDVRIEYPIDPSLPDVRIGHPMDPHLPDFGGAGNSPVCR